MLTRTYKWSTWEWIRYLLPWALTGLAIGAGIDLLIRWLA